MEAPGANGRKVVIDACAVIKMQRIDKLGSELFTTSGVLAEIKDEKARAMLDRLPVELKLQEPLPEDTAYVRNFAKATGDFGFLSRNDMDLIALTVHKFKQAGGEVRDRPVPLQTLAEFQTMAFDWAPSRAEKAGANRESAEQEPVAANGGGADKASASDGREADSTTQVELSEKFADVKVADADSAEAAVAAAIAAAEAAAEEEDEKNADAERQAEEQKEDEEAWEVPTKTTRRTLDKSKDNAAFIGTHPSKDSAATAKTAEAPPQEAKCDDGWSDDDDSEGEVSEDGSSAGEWVTQGNIKRFGVDVCQPEANEKEIKVTCATADYSVQNVLLQMGITPLTFDGYAVRSVKMWGLICRACFFFTRESSKVFCPKCGHDTLVRVPIVVGSDGKPTALNAGRKLRKKGTVFSMPKPQGGRVWKPILAEDEIKLGGRDREIRRQENLHNKERAAKDPFDLDNGARGWWHRSITSTGKMADTSAPRMMAGYGRMKNPNAGNFGGFKKGKRK